MQMLMIERNVVNHASATSAHPTSPPHFAIRRNCAARYTRTPAQRSHTSSTLRDSVTTFQRSFRLPLETLVEDALRGRPAAVLGSKAPAQAPATRAHNR